MPVQEKSPAGHGFLHLFPKLRKTLPFEDTGPPRVERLATARARVRTQSVGPDDGRGRLAAHRDRGEPLPVGGSGEAADPSQGAPQPARPPLGRGGVKSRERQPDPCTVGPAVGSRRAPAPQKLLAVTDRSHRQGRGLHYPSRTEMEKFPPKQHTPPTGLQHTLFCDTASVCKLQDGPRAHAGVTER